jgi:hypothetical protein
MIVSVERFDRESEGEMCEMVTYRKIGSRVIDRLTRVMHTLIFHVLLTPLTSSERLTGAKGLGWSTPIWDGAMEKVDDNEGLLGLNCRFRWRRRLMQIEWGERVIPGLARTESWQNNSNAPVYEILSSYSRHVDRHPVKRIE